MQLTIPIDALGERGSKELKNQCDKHHVQETQS